MKNMKYESYPPFHFSFAVPFRLKVRRKKWENLPMHQGDTEFNKSKSCIITFFIFSPFNEECKLKIVLEFKITHIKGFGFKINLIYLLLLTFYILENCISKFQLELENILQLKDDRSWKPFHLVNWKSRDRRQYNEEKEAESHFSPEIFIKRSILYLTCKSF